jgi:hypothetical protein
MRDERLNVRGAPLHEAAPVVGGFVMVPSAVAALEHGHDRAEWAHGRTKPRRDPPEVVAAQIETSHLILSVALVARCSIKPGREKEKVGCKRHETW